MDSLFYKIGLGTWFLCMGAACSGGSSGDRNNDASNLEQITIQPSVLTRSSGESFQFEAIGNYSDGSSNSITGEVSWSLADPSRATVDNINSKGLVTFQARGSTTLTASLDDLTGQANLTVLDNTSGTTASLLRVSADNPRYFENAQGEEILLAGSHTWLNAQDGGTSNPPTPFDYDAWLDFLELHNHNFFRLWTWEQAAWTDNEPTKWYLQPARYLRVGPELALDGDPKFDITQFNQAYFDRVRERIIAAGNRGMYVAVMLFQGWSVDFPKDNGRSNPWLGHPFNPNNNINNLGSILNPGATSGTEVHELNALTALQEQFVIKMIDTVNDLDNVIYEISNESHSASTAWQYHMIDFIRNEEAGRAKQHPIGMTYLWPGGNNAELFASSADWISYHRDGVDRLDPLIADGSKVIISDTDHHCGICGNRSWAWKSFTRGENPLFMDPYIDVYESVDYPLNTPEFVSLRQNLGYIRSYSQRIDLAQAVPCGALASTQNCLGYKSAGQAEFIVYTPSSGGISIDLSGANFELEVEWFNPVNGQAQSGGTVTGGGVAAEVFQPPWAGEAVLYIYTQ